MINYLLEISPQITADVAEAATANWPSLLTSFLGGGVLVAIVTGLINHLSNSSLRKKNADHEKEMVTLKNEHEIEMQKRDAEYQERLKTIELKHQKVSQENEATFKKEFEVLQNKYSQQQRSAEIINNYFACAGEYFANPLTDIDVENSFNAAHAAILRYLPKNCEALALNIYEFAYNEKYKDASDVLPALADEIRQHGLPF